MPAGLILSVTMLIMFTVRLAVMAYTRKGV